MTYLGERLVDLQRYLDDAMRLRERLTDPEALDRDLSVRNDVLHTLPRLCRMVIDVRGELSARAGLRVADDTEAVTYLRAVWGFPDDLGRALTSLHAFRNILVHEYVALDPVRVVRALHETTPIEAVVRLVAEREVADG